MVISVKRILFQGDSITDMYRVRDLDHYAGCGYATLVSAQLGYENPGEYRWRQKYRHTGENKKRRNKFKTRLYEYFCGCK